jgi:hypothetical protein
MHGDLPHFPDRRLKTCGDGEMDEIDGRLRQDSHGMAFQGNRKAAIRSPVRTGAGTVEDKRVIYDG